MLTVRKRVHPFPTRIPANRRRFCYVSSSPSPSPRKRRRVSPHSSSSVSLSLPSSIRPSRKRCRSPTTNLSLIRADLLPPRKRLRGSPSVVHPETSLEDSTERGYEASIKVSIGVGHEADIKPDTPPVLPEQIVAERLDDHEEVIQEKYDHLLDMPL
ncbi:hypothetical protein Tco_0251725 [Tanacetum coccineum]